MSFPPACRASTALVLDRDLAIDLSRLPSVTGRHDDPTTVVRARCAVVGA